MKEHILEFLKDFPIELQVLIISAIPVIELRGAIPIGIALGLSEIEAFLLSFLGSMLPVPFVLLFIKPIFEWLGKAKIFKKLTDRLTKRAEKKSGVITKYGFWGLAIFVGIPLPGTGVWSGALAANLMKLKFVKSIMSIAIGDMIAGIIVTLISSGAFMIFS